MTGTSQDLDFDFSRACHDPTALVITDRSSGGLTIGKRSRSGELHGCRDVADGPAQAAIVAAWMNDADRQGLAIDDRRKAR